jgi:hypothetical protein
MAIVTNVEITLLISVTIVATISVIIVQKHIIGIVMVQVMMKLNAIQYAQIVVMTTLGILVIAALHMLDHVVVQKAVLVQKILSERTTSI